MFEFSVEGKKDLGKATSAPPNDPLNVKKSDPSSKAVTLNWENSGAFGYVIVYQEGNGAPKDCNSGQKATPQPITSTQYNIETLLPEREYSFRICGTDGKTPPTYSKGVETTITTEKAAPPPDPVTPSANSATPDQITLTWVSGGASTHDYTITYQSGPTAPADCLSGIVIPPEDIEGPSHTVTGLLQDTEYSFRICSLNGNLTPESSTGIVFTQRTEGQALPPDPVGLSLIADSVSQISLSWNSGGGTTAAYGIAYATTPPLNCTSGSQIPPASIVGTSHVVTGLTHETTYYFRVCALNSDVLPDMSQGAIDSITTLGQASPPDPISPLATPDSQSQITLSWNSGGGTSAAYQIAYVLGETAPSDCNSGNVISAASISGLSHAVTGLTLDSNYSFRICALNDNASPDRSSGATVTAATQGRALPPDPINLTTNPDSTTDITITWDSGGGTTDDYRLSYQAGGSAPANCLSGTQISEASISGTSHTVTGLTFDSTYSFRVCALNADSVPDSSTGATITGNTAREPAPPNPTNPAAVADSITQISLTWDSGGGTTDDYRIRYQLDGTPADCDTGTLIGEGAISGTGHTIASLAIGAPYGFRICAINENSPPDVSSGLTISQATQSEAAPPDPNTLGFTIDSPTEVTVNWNSGGGTTDGFFIAYQSGSTPPADCSTGTVVSQSLASGTSRTIVGLSDDTQYSVRVCSYNQNYNTDVSTGITGDFTTPPSLKVRVQPANRFNRVIFQSLPSAVGYLVVRRATSVTFTPTDGIDYPLGSLGSGNELLAKGDVRSYLDFNLANGTSYAYKVFSYDAGFNYLLAEEDSGTPTGTGNFCTSVANRGGSFLCQDPSDKPASNNFAGGDGTSGDPYIICTPSQFNQIRNYSTAHYQLGADIDLSGIATIPSFSGVLDGLSQGLWNIDVTEDGVFKDISGATIQNLTLASGTITTTTGGAEVLAESGDNVTLNHVANCATLNVTGDNGGGLMGTIGPTAALVSNVASGGTMTVTGGNAGGIIGESSGALNLTKAYHSGVLSAGNDLGGIVGEHSGTATWSDLLNGGTLANAITCGGIVGRANGLTLSQSENRRGFSCHSYTVGIIGHASASDLDNTHNHAAIGSTTASHTGGILAYGINIDLQNSTNSAAINGLSYTGGIAGQTGNPSDFTSVTNSGPVTGLDYTGGAVGHAASLTFTSLSVTNSVNGFDRTGGLMGYASNASYSNLTNSVTVDGNNSTGGLIGEASNVDLTNCTNNQTVDGYNDTGGLIGRAIGGTFTNPVNDRSVSGYRSVGGVVGYAQSVTISTPLNKDPVDGYEEIGGIVGESSGVIITDATNQSTISSGMDYCGGIIGRAAGGSHIYTATNTGLIYGGYDFTGGIVGDASGMDLHDVTNSRAISGGYKDTGGIAGRASNSDIYNASNNSSITGDYRYAGGIVGTASNTDVQYARNTGSVHADYRQAGGIAGRAISGSYLHRVVNEATVSAAYRETGGIVGELSASTITNAANTGNINGDYKDTGGIAGVCGGSIITYVANYRSSVTGDDDLGGICGGSVSTTSAYSVTVSAATNTVGTNVTMSLTSFKSGANFIASPPGGSPFNSGIWSYSKSYGGQSGLAWPDTIP